MDKAKLDIYLFRIKNRAKRLYAMQYAKFLLDGEVGYEPAWECSWTAVQEVRKEVRALIAEAKQKDLRAHIAEAEKTDQKGDNK